MLPSASTPDRRLAWDGCANVRDLGGHETEDGRRTRDGVVVRADSVRRLSDDGWRALVEYGVTRIVDLRFHSELDADPPRELPVEVVHIPLLPDPGAEFWTEIAAIERSSNDDVTATRDVYCSFLERRRPEFARAVAAVADVSDGAVVVHCAGGKDRTGLVTALILRLAGVGMDVIATDYGDSGPNLAAVHERWLAEAPDEDERERRRRISVCPPEAMVGVLTEVERRHDNVREYLRGSGVRDAQLDALVGRLVA